MPYHFMRFYAVVDRISAPFDGQQKVEVRMKVDEHAPVHGELTVRVNREQAELFALGDVHAIRCYKVG